MILKNLVIKMGRLKVVFLITLSSILLSCFINWLGSFFYNYNHDFLFISYLISIIVPLIVAPLCSWALIGLLLKINQMENRMRYIATTDQLTGVKSRASFFSLSDSALNYVIQNKKKCTLIMLDLDFFKSINDTYGHAGGDIVLRNFGNLLKSICRKGDIIGRIGGEEFCILLIGCDSENAVKIAKEIILKIRKQIIKYDNKIITYTASLGISSFEKNLTLDQLLQQADEALYISKNSGRDKYFIYSQIK